MRSGARLSVLLFAVLAGCGEGTEAVSNGMAGSWMGTSASGLTVAVEVERGVPASDSVVALQGVLTIGDPRCLRSAPFAGTLTRDVLEISASGAGTVSASTFVDINGLLAGNRVDGESGAEWRRPTRGLRSGPTRPHACEVMAMLIRVVVLAALPVLWSPSASADHQTADEWNAQGVQHRKQLQPAKALEAFRKAHEIHPTARSRGQMGFVEHDLGQYLAAEQHLVEALAVESDPWVMKNRKYLSEALELTRRHLGHVTVNGPAGATVTVQGTPVGTLPLSRPLSLLEGETSIEVSGAGYLPWEQRLTIAPGKTVDLTADLVPDRRDLPGLNPTPVSGTPSVDRPTLAASRDQPAGSPAAGDVWRRRGAWTLVGVGAALAGAALWSHTTREPSCPDTGRTCNELPRSSWPTVALAGGSVLAAAGGIALFAW